jgi:hypothetical protein
VAAKPITGRASSGACGRRPGAGIALASLGLVAAGCSHALPLGPTPPAQQHLATPIVLRIVRGQPASPAGSCPAGSARLPRQAAGFPGSGQCYRQLGQPLTVTSAAVAYAHQPAGHQRPASYGVLIKLPASSRATLLTMTARAYRARDSLAVIVGGRTWAVPVVLAPFTAGQFEIPAPSAKRALQLQRALVPAT